MFDVFENDRVIGLCFVKDDAKMFHYYHINKEINKAEMCNILLPGVLVKELTDEWREGGKKLMNAAQLHLRLATCFISFIYRNHHTHLKLTERTLEIAYNSSQSIKP